MKAPHELRDLARGARRLAESLSAETDRARLLLHAQELEQQAAELEKGTGPTPMAPLPGAAPIRQEQVQVQQQQHETGPSADSENQKPKD